MRTVFPTTILEIIACLIWYRLFPALATNYRLATNVKPIKYHLIMMPDFRRKQFYGSINITLIIFEPTSLITLHKNDINIENESINLYEINDNTTKYRVINTNETTDDRDFFNIYFNNQLNSDSMYVLSIKEFRGRFNDDNTGFYLGYYRDKDGGTRTFATTQFEPTYARKAFPCFDEPALKATFQISIIRPSDYNSISNENLLTTKMLKNGLEMDIFKTTPNMSTYLVAFVVSEFESIKFTNKVTHRIFAANKSIDMSRFALNFGKSVLETLSAWLNVSYSLGKIDQVAISDEYYTFGAMENWGLVTYRESYLLAGPETSAATNQTVALTIGHEFAHQWFGNLVTCDWWRYVWLNEGFATYFQVAVVDALRPEWALHDQFVVKDLQSALARDSVQTRSMNANAQTPDEIYHLFDEITYAKSGSVIRMVETFLGRTCFLDGLRIYLKNWQYMTAVPTHLYSALQMACVANRTLLPKNKTVRDVLNTWDSQAGYPLITVTRNENTTLFKQERFFLERSQKINNKQIWSVPITFAINEGHFQNTATRFWLISRRKSLKLNLTEADWIIVNVQERGFYRVNYDESNWMLVIRLLNSNNYTVVHRANRAQIVDDAFNLARSGIIRYNIAFQVANYMKRELDHIPLYAFTSNLKYLDSILWNTCYYNLFKMYVIGLLGKSFVRIMSQKDDGHLEKLNGDLIMTWLCRLGHERCKQWALQELHQWKLDGNHAIMPDLQKSLLCGAIVQGNIDDRQFLWNKYHNKTENNIMKLSILSGLACSENEKILKRYLDEIFFFNHLSADHKQEAFELIVNLPIGLNFFLQYIYDNHKKFNEISILEDQVLSLTSRITTSSNLNLVNQISRRFNYIKLKNALFQIERNVQQANKNLKEISLWLLRNSSTKFNSVLFLLITSCIFI